MTRNNFIERSIIGALNYLRESVFSEEISQRKGFMQALDPRIKLLVCLLLLFLGLISRSPGLLLALYCLCLILAMLSKIDPLFFLVRTWVFIPFFSLFIALPSIFSFFSPGEALVSWKGAGFDFTVTRQGLEGFLFFILRVATCVSLAVLLSVTTRHFELLKALRSFKIPQVFIMTIGTSYRYIYLFIEMVLNTYKAIKSRVGFLVKKASARNIVGWGIASLWKRSLSLNEEVYKAMLSRGYRGQALAWEDFRLKPNDLFCLFAAVLFAAIFLKWAA